MKPNFIFTLSLVLATLIFINGGVALASYPVSTNTEYAFITNNLGNSITVVDTSTNETVTTLNTNSGPTSVVVNKAGTCIYVSNGRDNSIIVYDTIDYSIVKYISLPYAPLKLEMNSNGNTIYAICGNTPSSSTTEYILVIDTNTYAITDTILLPNIISASALTGDDTYLVVSIPSSKTLIRYDTTTWENVVYNIGAIHPSSTPTALSSYYDTYASGIWVLCNDKAYNYDPYSNLLGELEGFEYSNITLTKTGRFIDASSFGRSSLLYVSYSDSNNVTRYKANSIIYWNTTIPGTSGYVSSIQLNGDGTKLYVTNSYDNKMYILETSNGNILGYINTGNYPMRITIKPVVIDNTQSVSFTLQSLFGNIKYPNINSSVYDESGRFVYSGVTGIDGVVSYNLNPKIKYTISFIDITRAINTSVTLYPAKTAYWVDAGLNPIINFNGLWHSTDINQSYQFTAGSGDPLQDVTLTVSQSPRNTHTSRVFTASYKDDTASTSNVNFSLYKVENNLSTYVSSQVFNLAETGELIKNGDCENGYPTLNNDGSAINADYTISNSFAHSGSNSIRIGAVSPGTIDRFYQFGSLTMNGLIPSKTYKLDTWVYVPAGQGINLDNVFLIAYDGVSTYSSNRPTRTDTWEHLTLTFTESPGATWGMQRLYLHQDFANDTYMYMDDASLSSNGVACTFNIANETQNKNPSTYKIISDADTEAYGNVIRISYASWDGTGYLLPGLGLDNKALPYEWICFGIIFLIIIIGTFMSNGVIIFIAGAAWEIMIAIGWMASSTQNLALGALVMAIGAGYVLMQKRREVV